MDSWYNFYQFKTLQSSFFDFEDKFKKLDEKDPLIKLTQLIDWEMFRSTLEKVREKEKKARRAESPMMLF